MTLLVPGVTYSRPARGTRSFIPEVQLSGHSQVVTKSHEPSSEAVKGASIAATQDARDQHTPTETSNQRTRLQEIYQKFCWIS